MPDDPSSPCVYTDADIDAIIAAVGSIPSEPVRHGKAHGRPYRGVHIAVDAPLVDRRQELRELLECVARAYEAFRGRVPTEAELLKYHKDIAGAARKLAKVISRLPSVSIVTFSPGTDCTIGETGGIVIYTESVEGDPSSGVSWGEIKLYAEFAKYWAERYCAGEDLSQPTAHGGKRTKPGGQQVSITIMLEYLGPVYEHIFCREPGKSPTGPFARFLHAALEPILRPDTPSPSDLIYRWRRLCPKKR